MLFYMKRPHIVVVSLFSYGTIHVILWSCSARVSSWLEAQKHPCQLGLQVENLWLWTGSASNRQHANNYLLDRLCSYPVVPCPRALWLLLCSLFTRNWHLVCWVYLCWDTPGQASISWTQCCAAARANHRLAWFPIWRSCPKGVSCSQRISICLPKTQCFNVSPEICVLKYRLTCVRFSTC